MVCTTTEASTNMRVIIEFTPDSGIVDTTQQPPELTSDAYDELLPLMAQFGTDIDIHLDVDE